MPDTEVWSHRIPHTDPRLDWSPQHDPRSLGFPITTALPPTVEIAPKAWTLGAILDQGNEGACVGFGHTADLIAAPKGNYTVGSADGDRYAQNVYQRAKQLDSWPGEAYDGTSVLAGDKVMAERGFITSYRWAFSVEDIRDAIIAVGPVVIGIPWYSAMYQTKANGVVDVDGILVGGHCLCVYAYHPNMRIYGEPPNPLNGTRYYEVFKWRNSWGTSYGKNGNGIVHINDLRTLLADQGEASVAMGRTRADLTKAPLSVVAGASG